MEYKRPGIPVFLLIAYTAWLITTPQNSPNFRFLTDIQFERILAASTLIAILVQGPSSRVRYRIVSLVIALFLFTFVSYGFSPYADNPRCMLWADEYWKEVVFFLFLVYGLRNLEELSLLLRWTVYIELAYQLLTWRDFLAGGAYVYQQGIKRMCGTWSGGGLGSANALASMCVFTMPFAVWLFKTGASRRLKILGLATTGLSILSIVFSGTRGAFIAAVLYVAALTHRQLFRVHNAVIGLGLLVLLFLVVPQSVIDRYAGSFGVISEKKNLTEDEKVAKESAEGRIDGLVDGFSLGAEQPILGYGPGSSPTARLKIRQMEAELQLHNLFGQIVGEIGFVGFGLWLILIVNSIQQLLRIRPASDAPISDRARLALSLRSALLQSILLFLFYGNFSHSLYDFRWLYVFGCETVLISAYAQVNT
jgi:O-antigen ligase